MLNSLPLCKRSLLMPNFISEDQIEKAAVSLLKDKCGYRILNCFTQEADNLNDSSNRSSKQEVVFINILKEYAMKLNRNIPEPVVDEALSRLTAHRYAMSPILANKEVYGLIRDGILVQYENKSGKTEHGIVNVIDFGKPKENDFLAVTQLWIKGDRYPRRPDILIYVNGLPLVFIELKNSNVKVRNAYDDNLTNYKQDIPLLFQYNAFCVLTNALETVKIREEKQGKLGVFWHTQGSGKSFSMIFLARKIFHRFTGNYTFVIV